VEKYSNTKTNYTGQFLKIAAALVAANFFFGTNVIAVKKISPVFIPPISLGYLRMLFATVVFFLVSFFMKKQEKIKKEDYPSIFFAALTGISLNQILSINGIATTNPIHASLLNMATPIFVSILATLFLKERFGWNKAIGLLLGIAGAWLMIITRANGTSQNPAIGAGRRNGIDCSSLLFILFNTYQKDCRTLSFYHDFKICVSHWYFVQYSLLHQRFYRNFMGIYPLVRLLFGYSTYYF